MLYFACDRCNFHSKSRSQLNFHKGKKHSHSFVDEEKKPSTLQMIKNERTEHGITTKTHPSKHQECGQAIGKDYTKKHQEERSKSGMKCNSN